MLKSNMERDALVGLRYCLGKIEITQKREKVNPDAMEKIMTELFVDFDSLVLQYGYCLSSTDKTTLGKYKRR